LKKVVFPVFVFPIIPILNIGYPHFINCMYGINLFSTRWKKSRVNLPFMVDCGQTRTIKAQRSKHKRKNTP
jgi:hypothetical protein